MQKTKVASAVESTLDNLAIVNAIGANLGLIDKKQGEIDKLKEDINQKIVVLFNRKVVVGRYSKDGATKGCAYACAFVDISQTVITLANSEDLPAHGEAMTARLEDL